MSLVRNELLSRIREIENVFIPMPDGTQLAARVFLPKDSIAVPAILEYIPYRKRDFMRERDEPMHRYFAAHGFAVVRLDVRGSGDSDGVMTDEYTAQEIDDGVEAIAWIAEQDWCDGAVGMMGISWGGFNSLQVAAKRPPALRAIMTLCAADDRYADDAHYMGGCLLNENMQWGSILMTYNAMPPDPLIVGDRWKEMWMERLENAVAFPNLWSRHPHRDEYWQHGSVCENFDDIECPVYAVGGWADGYSNAIGRLLSGLKSPRKGLIGPWAHNFPHNGRPGPAIGFLQEAIRWWNHWLKGEDTGIMDEPQLRVWMQQSVAPKPQYAQRPGRWVAEASWPSTRITSAKFFLNRERIERNPAPGRAMEIRSPQRTGAVAGEWCAFGSRGELPVDQRPDDGRSLVFDSEPLEEGFEILGAPVVELEIATDVEVAMIAVRLNEVTPMGASTRVTYGLLNLTHRDGHSAPKAMNPGERTTVTVRLNDIAHAFGAGSRMRVAVSTSYWPTAWPSPTPVTLSVWPGSSSLTLPVRPVDANDDALPAFLDPEEAPGSEHTPIRPLPFRRTVERDLVTNEVIYTLKSDGGEFGDHSLAKLEEIDLTLGYSMLKRHRIGATDPLSACTEISQWISLAREGWEIRIECETSLRSQLETLHFTAEIKATENGQVVFARTWDEQIPRKLF